MRRQLPHRETAPQGKQPPKAPPVYRPQPLPRVAQTKMSATDKPTNRSTVLPVAPPVYRPQPTPKILQSKLTDNHRSGMAKSPPRQPVLRPAQTKIAQPKAMPPPRKSPVAPPVQSSKGQVPPQKPKQHAHTLQMKPIAADPPTLRAANPVRGSITRVQAKPPSPVSTPQPNAASLQRKNKPGGAVSGRCIQRFTERSADGSAYFVSENEQLAIRKDGNNKEYYSTSGKILESNVLLSQNNSPIKLERMEALKGIYTKDRLYRVVPVRRADPRARLLTRFACIDVAREVVGHDLSQVVFNQGKVHLNPYEESQFGCLDRQLAAEANPLDITERMWVIGQSDVDESDYVFDYLDQNFDFRGRGKDNLQKVESKMFGILKLSRSFVDGVIHTLRKIHDDTAMQQNFMNMIKARFGKDYVVEDKSNRTKEDLELETRIKSFGESLLRVWMNTKRTRNIGRFAENARAMGVNESARPNVGEAFSIISTGERKVGETKWNFHFAAVIARDQGDYITIENYPTTDAHVEHPEDLWHFKMYGSKVEQTFHDRHKSSTVSGITAVWGKA